MRFEVVGKGGKGKKKMKRYEISRWLTVVAIEGGSKPEEYSAWNSQEQVRVIDKTSGVEECVRGAGKKNRRRGRKSSR